MTTSSLTAQPLLDPGADISRRLTAQPRWQRTLRSVRAGATRQRNAERTSNPAPLLPAPAVKVRPSDGIVAEVQRVEHWTPRARLPKVLTARERELDAIRLAAQQRLADKDRAAVAAVRARVAARAVASAELQAAALARRKAEARRKEQARNRLRTADRRVQRARAAMSAATRAKISEAMRARHAAKRALAATVAAVEIIKPSATPKPKLTRDQKLERRRARYASLTPEQKRIWRGANYYRDNREAILQRRRRRRRRAVA